MTYQRRRRLSGASGSCRSRCRRDTTGWWRLPAGRSSRSGSIETATRVAAVAGAIRSSRRCAVETPTAAGAGAVEFVVLAECADR